MGFCDHTSVGYVNRMSSYVQNHQLLMLAPASEGIALKLRRQASSRRYLYVQIFAGLAYVTASGFMAELRRVKRRQNREHSV
jgi:hypothetical protein